MPLNDEQSRLAQARVDAARIPRENWRHRLPDLGPTGSRLRDYLTGDQYSQDASNGIGVHIYGRGVERLRALPTFAKELALGGVGVLLVSVSTLIDNLNGEEDSDLILMMPRYQHLCINRFHQEGDSPYTRRELRKLEEFIMDRADEELATSFTAGVPLLQCDWYSMDFREMMSVRTRPFEFKQ